MQLQETNAVFKSEVFEYNNTPITFELENGDVMVNATHMAKAFGKLTGDFLRLDQTKAFIEAVKTRYGISHNEILTVLKGGDVQGTWMNRKLALKFAAWLSPDFEVWIYDCIEELLSKGSLKLPQTLSQALRLAADQAEVIEEQNKIIELQKPKALFADSVNASSDTILIGDLAKILNQNGIDIGQNRLFDWLRDKGYLMNRNGSKNMPTQKAMDLGVFFIQERTINKPDGSSMLKPTVKVTGKGQLYFINKFLNKQS